MFERIVEVCGIFIALILAVVGGFWYEAAVKNSALEAAIAAGIAKEHSYDAINKALYKRIDGLQMELQEKDIALTGMKREMEKVKKTNKVNEDLKEANATLLRDCQRSVNSVNKEVERENRELKETNARIGAINTRLKVINARLLKGCP